MSDLREKLEALVVKLRERAMIMVPPEYADRDMHSKYLKLDNTAAGLDEAADEVEALLRETALAERAVPSADILGRVRMYLESWQSYPAKELGEQPTKFVHGLLAELYLLAAAQPGEPVLDGHEHAGASADCRCACYFRGETDERHFQEGLQKAQPGELGAEHVLELLNEVDKEIGEDMKILNAGEYHGVVTHAVLPMMQTKMRRKLAARSAQRKEST